MSIKWILGSGSPRRKELLAGIGIDFEVRTKDTAEDYPESLPLEEVPMFLAELKAQALFGTLAVNEALICADTIVLLGNEILGKPLSKNEAIKMLQKLSGNTHTVITGVFIGNNHKKHLFSDTTLVTFAELSTEEIENYIDTYKPYDKAGSYGVQEWLGYVAVSKLEGTYTNVMGLPTNLVHKRVKEFTVQ